MKPQKRKRYINLVLALNRLNSQLFEAEKELHCYGHESSEASHGEDEHTVAIENKIEEIHKKIEICRAAIHELYL